MGSDTWLAIGLLAFLYPVPVMAYVDPGTGVLLWQGLLSLVAAVVVFIGRPIQAIRRLIDRIRRR
jgi:hypothetical protein